MTGPASREVAARHLLFAVDLSDFARGRLVLRPIAPGMDRWSRLWMGLKEVMKDVQQNQYMFLVTTELRLANIMNNDVTDFFGAVLWRQQILAECRCSSFR
jgi:hypothetical protein